MTKQRNRHITHHPDIARAAGLDAGNRSMRKACRTTWNEDDFNAASEAWSGLMATMAEAA